MSKSLYTKQEEDGGTSRRRLAALVGALSVETK